MAILFDEYLNNSSVVVGAKQKLVLKRILLITCNRKS
jgi:hypothetical protein